MRLHVGFNDGTFRDVDLSHLKGPVFEPLRDSAYFAQVRVDTRRGTVFWPNGVDLDPDVLHGSEQAASAPGVDEVVDALLHLSQVLADASRALLHRLADGRRTHA
jgi:hypothetical protein